MNASLIAGTLLLVLGSATLIFGVFRAVTNTWTFGGYEVWVLPATGLALVLLGRLMLA
jgi:hypothetical protein